MANEKAEKLRKKMNEFPRNPEVVTSRYRGPNRRLEPSSDAEAEVRVSADVKGDPVLEVRIVSPRRREDDDTVNQMECLEVESLTLESDEDEDGSNFLNPYAKARNA